MVQLKADVNQFKRGMSEAQTSIKGFEKTTGTTLDKVGKTMGSIGKGLTLGVTAPLLGMAGVAAKVGMEYEASMSNVQAISGATADDMAVLESVAREMGATTRYSASEAADGLSYMALAGWDAQQMSAALPSVLNLATAGQLDLATASDIVTDMMSMFGMEAEDAAKASDIFASAQSNSNTNVEQLAEALRMAGPAAASAGSSLEDTSAVLGILANNGIKGSSAGTALNAMFMDLQKSAEDGAVSIGDTAVAVYDAEGNMRSIVDIIQDVESATAGMNDEQRNAALSSIFQQRSLRGVNVLLNEGTGSLVDLQGELNNSTGASQEMADVMDDNMQGALLSMKSAAEDVAISFFEMAEGPLRNLIERITEIIRWFGNLDESTQQTIVMIAGIAAAVGPVLIVLGALIGSISKIIAAVKAVGAAIAFLTSPIGLAIAAIAALVAAGVWLYQNWDLVKEKASQLGEWISNTWENLKTWTSETWDAIATAISESVSNAWNAIIEWFGQLPEWFRNTWETIKESVTNFVATMIEKAIELGSQFLENVMNFFDTLPENIGFVIGTVIGLVAKFVIDMVAKAIELGSQFLSNLVEWFKQLPGRIQSFLTSTWNNVVQWATNMGNKARETGTNFINTIVSFFSQLPGRIQSWVTNALNRVIAWASNMANKARETGSRFLQNVINFFQQLPGRVQTWLTNVISRVTTWGTNLMTKGREAGRKLTNGIMNVVRELPGKIKDAGVNVVKGFWNGIKSMESWLRGLVTDFFGGIIDGVKGVFGIKSPSRVFRNEIGAELPAGAGLGIEDEENVAVKAMQSMVDNVLGVWDNAGLLSAQVSGMVGHTVSNEVNMTNDYTAQPAYINLNIGGRVYRAFVDDITNAQDQNTELELDYA